MYPRWWLAGRQYLPIPDGLVKSWNSHPAGEHRYVGSIVYGADYEIAATGKRRSMERMHRWD